MNPISILASIAFRTVLNNVAKPEPQPVAVEPEAPKRKGRPAKTAPETVPAPVRRNYRPLIRVGLAFAWVGLGLYLGQMDTATALSTLATIDFNSILSLFGG